VDAPRDPQAPSDGVRGHVQPAMPKSDAVASEEGFPRLSGPRLRENIALVSAVLLVGLVIELSLIAWMDPAVGRPLLKMVVVEMFAGREAGIPFAIGSAENLLIAQVSTTQDIALAGIIYPGFLYMLAKYRHRDNLVMRRLRRIELKAHERRDFIRKWGPLGIFAFMLVPFLVNGPVLGAAIGRISGIPTRYLITPVVCATALSSLMWTYFYNALFGLVSPEWGPLLTFVILGGIISWELLGEWRERRREQQAKRRIVGPASP